MLVKTDGRNEGYKIVKIGGESHRVMDPERRPVLKLILQMFNDGKSWADIRDHLNNVARIPTNHGTKWHYSTLVNAAANELKFQWIEIHAGDWGREPAGRAHNNARTYFGSGKYDWQQDGDF